MNATASSIPLNPARCDSAAAGTGPKPASRTAVHDERTSREHALAHCNRLFADLSAEKRVGWALRNLPERAVLSSSFGAQAAVSLHLLNSQCPGIPVIFIDTGYLFAETYHFVDELSGRLQLNLQ
ncbi:MAG TPA: hypothetical protein ENK16_08805, partial [Chromatiales bacterium]|nr:hypothetical protein [Chromatiales bacterium]